MNKKELRDQSIEQNRSFCANRSNCIYTEKKPMKISQRAEIQKNELA